MMVPLLLTLGRHDPLATAQDHLARRCASELERRGLRWRSLAHEHGLELSRPHREGARILACSQHAFIRDAERLAGDPYLGWSLGAWDLRDLGLFGYSLLNAPDVGAALDMMTERSVLLSEAANFVLRVEDDEVLLGQRFTANAAMSAATLNFFLTILRQLTGAEFEPLRLGVNQTDQAWLDSLGEQVGRRIEGVEAPVTYMTFRAEVLDRPVVGADAALLRTLDRGWDRERQTMDSNRALLAQMETVIVHLLPSELPTISHVAAALGIAMEQLDDRLERMGLCVHDIVDAVRGRLALRLLARPNITLMQAAQALGFSDAKGFINAYRRWRDAPPVNGRGRSLPNCRHGRT